MIDGSLIERAEPNPNAAFVDTSLMTVAISLPTIATICVLLRFMARRWKGNKTSNGDDWTILITLFFCWGHSTNTLIAAGLGGINTITISPRDYAQLALRTLWISTFFLVTALYTVKVSILLFYWHIFYISPRFRKACIGMICLLTAWWLAAIICAFLVGDPIDSSWKDAAHAKHRFNFNAWYMSYSGLSIVFDIVILLFPVPVIKTLKVNTRRKISIIGIFWLGGFVCVSAIIRFVLLYNSVYRLSDFGKNQYSSITNAFIWSEIEPNCSVIAACLPTFSPFFKKENGIMRMPKFISSFRSTFGMSSSSENKTDAPVSNKGLSAGYLELERTAGSTRGTAHDDSFGRSNA